LPTLRARVDDLSAGWRTGRLAIGTT